ncbi:ABC transporter permease [uncultured Candidatus Puniceispirillum sp.]|uniref:ABC transporter permease n=1 Tax=uncultured Candidatus Puniceispirillum sp. TaxID=1985115 RepID=UPI0032B1620B
MIWRLTIGSLAARALTVFMTIIAIALSVALFLTVDKIRTGAKASFTDTISGTDLIVGARSGSVQLLLYSVFRIGNATNNVSWDSYSKIASRPEIDWIVPISLGDSHRQFRVMGTTTDFFEYYKYRQSKSLEFTNGAVMADLYDTVIGADVASSLGYSIGDPIIVSHGIASFSDHDDQPFRVHGILAKTGTPVDRTVILSLEAIEAIHVDWQSGGKTSNHTTPAEQIRQMELRPKSITAALLGVKSKLQIFSLQRAINQYNDEPLLAILPGLALQELWSIIGIAEMALVWVSWMVILTALIGMSATICSSLNERRREMAIFRSVGARPRFILFLFMTESMFMAVSGILIGVAIVYSGLFVAQPILDNMFGIWVPITMISKAELFALFGVLGAAALVSLLPALMAYRLSLADGMVVKT